MMEPIRRKFPLNRNKVFCVSLEKTFDGRKKKHSLAVLVVLVNYMIGCPDCFSIPIETLPVFIFCQKIVEYLNLVGNRSRFSSDYDQTAFPGEFIQLTDGQPMSPADNGAGDQSDTHTNLSQLQAGTRIIGNAEYGWGEHFTVKCIQNGFGPSSVQNKRVMSQITDGQ